MTKKTHIIYLVIIGILALAVCGAVFLGKRGVFANAEKLVVLPSKSFFVHDSPILGKYVSVEGTWRIEGETTGFPKHVWRYECSDRETQCEAAEALVYQDGLSLNMSKVDISKWDSQQLIMIENGECRFNTIVINLLTEDVTAIVKDTPNRPLSCDSNSPALSKPRISHLINGFDESFGPVKK